jgi:hypothetical protein
MGLTVTSPTSRRDRYIRVPRTKYNSRPYCSQPFTRLRRTPRAHLRERARVRANKRRRARARVYARLPSRRPVVLIAPIVPGVTPSSAQLLDPSADFMPWCLSRPPQTTSSGAMLLARYPAGGGDSALLGGLMQPVLETAVPPASAAPMVTPVGTCSAC